MNFRLLPSFLLLFLAAVTLQAQSGSLRSEALRHFQQKAEDWQLSAEDLQDLQINDQYKSVHNGVTHIYFQQRYLGIPVFNAISAVHISTEGKVLFSTNRFYDQLSNRVNSAAFQLAPAKALGVASRDLNLALRTENLPVIRTGQGRYRISAPQLSEEAIDVSLVYQPLPNGELRLSWQMGIADPVSPDFWTYRIDATTGAIIGKDNATLYCNFDDKQHRHDPACMAEHGLKPLDIRKTGPVSPELLYGEANDNAAYNVFAVPLESPIHGERSMVMNPADPLASPFGWHDINGEVGPEYTITRGNNVHAFIDRFIDNPDFPDEPEPDGGPELIFDFPYADSLTAGQNEKAGVTQLFYMNNVMHDLTYHYGFDEAAGNFQQNQYGRATNGGGDPVSAQGFDGSGTNNANFRTLRDGASGRMQMYLWGSFASAQLLLDSTIQKDPVDNFAFAQFTPLIPDNINGQIVPITERDSSFSACATISNTEGIQGKIALIALDDEADCEGHDKTLAAQAAGATAVLIRNPDRTPATLLLKDSLPFPRIPTLSLDSNLANRILQRLDTASAEVTLLAPDWKDSNFDNGVVAHEYGHGISNRLTGGPDAFNCLRNDEQMGEGWSDFFALITTVQPSDDGVDPRGIGTFLVRQGVSGGGIRRQRYSTDMEVNNQTYDDIIGTNPPHPLGEIWVATLWDLYWAMVDRYGFDPNQYTGTGGNNLAIQLVMDGMKLQACSPGMIDGRDAIIAADLINNNGENECLIYEVFARRGLGWSADQGSNFNRNDNIEAFDTNPACNPMVSVTKTSTDLIDAGETFTVQIEIVNDKPAAVTDLVIADEIPEFATYVDGSLQGASNVTVENGVIVIELDRLASSGNKIIRYQLQSDPGLASINDFRDDVEGNTLNFIASDLNGNQIWRKSGERAFSGQRSWYVANSSNRNDQALQSFRPVTLLGDKPVLRFYHSYEIEPGVDGGVIEISTNNGNSWRAVSATDVFKNGYRGRVVPFERDTKGFWGTTEEEFVQTYVDLSRYKGEDILYRFRYGSDEEPPEQFGGIITDGWYIDDIELIDMVNYESAVMVTTAEGDTATAMVQNRGTVIETDQVTPTTALTDDFAFEVYPNPADSRLQLSLYLPGTDEVQIELLNASGQLVRSVEQEAFSGQQTLTLNTNDLSDGVYFIRLITDAQSYSKKVIINH